MDESDQIFVDFHEVSSKDRKQQQNEKNIQLLHIIKRKIIHKVHLEEQKHKYKKGHWSPEEHQQYLNFLKKHENQTDDKKNKRSLKIFKRMSKEIGTRSPSQCRSHHQKFNPNARDNLSSDKYTKESTGNNQNSLSRSISKIPIQTKDQQCQTNFDHLQCPTIQPISNLNLRLQNETTNHNGGFELLSPYYDFFKKETDPFVYTYNYGRHDGFQIDKQ